MRIFSILLFIATFLMTFDNPFSCYFKDMFDRCSYENEKHETIINYHDNKIDITIQSNDDQNVVTENTQNRNRQLILNENTATEYIRPIIVENIQPNNHVSVDGLRDSIQKNIIKTESTIGENRLILSRYGQ